MRAFLISLFIIGLLASCLDEPPCAASSTSPVIFSFRSVEDGSDSTVLVDSIYIRDPELLLYREVSIPSGIFPLYPDQDEIYLVVSAGGVTDSLLLTYNRKPVLYATNCEVEFEYIDIELSDNTFDSLNLLLDQKPPAIEIFF